MRRHSMRKFIVFGAFVAILVILNFVIYQKEEHISNGKSILLKLAPVDPRSLMQGDYMALRFEMARDIYRVLPHEQDKHRWIGTSIEGNDGYVLVNIDKDKVATFDSLYKGNVLKENQMLLQYRIRAGKVKFASNAFFFEEGTASAYEEAKYGEFKVNDAHELLLVDMYDENLVKIVAKQNN